METQVWEICWGADLLCSCRSIFPLPSLPHWHLNYCWKGAAVRAKGNILILILRRRQWKPRFPTLLPTGAFQVSSLDVTHSAIRHVYIYIFEDSRLETFFSPLRLEGIILKIGQREHKREERRQLPSSPTELLSSWISIFKGSCTERKGPRETDSQRVRGLRQSGGLMATETAAHSNGTTIEA